MGLVRQRTTPDAYALGDLPLLCEQVSELDILSPIAECYLDIISLQILLLAFGYK